MKKYRTIILIAFLGGITLFTVIKYISSQRENYYLSSNLNLIKEQIDSLEIERQKLLQTLEKQSEENLALKANQERLAKIEQSFIQAQKTIEELNSEAFLVKAENATLREQSDNLKLQFSQVSQEKDTFQAKLSSLTELKKAIKELKIKMHQAKMELRKKSIMQMLIEGNRGYIIRDGKPTYPTKIRIEVNPAH